MNVSEFVRVCGLSRPTVYKYMKMMGKLRAENTPPSIHFDIIPA